MTLTKGMLSQLSNDAEKTLYAVLVGLVLWCLTPLSNNISAILWRSVLLVEKTGGPGENHRPVANH